MAICQTCGKKSQRGKKVSHSHQKSNRRFKPNLQKVKVIEEGELVKKTLCSKCIKKTRRDN